MSTSWLWFTFYQSINQSINHRFLPVFFLFHTHCSRSKGVVQNKNHPAGYAALNFKNHILNNQKCLRLPPEEMLLTLLSLCLEKRVYMDTCTGKILSSFVHYRSNSTVDAKRTVLAALPLRPPQPGP